MSKTKCSFASLLVFAFTFFTSSFLIAQNVVTGDVAGTITDPSGAVVPGAKVELKNGETGFDKSATTGNAGDFRFSLLKPGQYVLTITSSAFNTVTRPVDVNLGQVTNASTALSVGTSQTTVEVSGESPLLQTENANITTTVDSRVVQELPNPGGDITYFANIAPGIAQSTSGGGYGNFSAFGLPATSNLFTENGNDENDPFLNLNNSGSSNLLLGKNEVQEVAVVTNGYTGQYGRQAGADVNYTTKSGTNQFHGDATYDWNGRLMNANEWFNKQAGNPRPFANSNEWAADFGGPIKKNKTFFYADTEGIRYILPSEQQVYFPTPAFAAATLANIAAVSPSQLPFYQKMMGLYQSSPAYPNMKPYSQSPSASDATGGCGDLASAGFGTGGAPCLQYALASGENLNKEWLLTTRIDQNIGNSDVLFGRYKMDRGQQPTSTDIVNNSLFGTHSNQPSYEGQLNETHTFSPSLVNSFIASGLWYSAVFVRNSGEAAALAALPYSTVGFGGTEEPLSPLGGTSANGPDYVFPQGRNVTQWQLVDDISWTKGKHELKFGTNFRRNDISDYDVQEFTGGYLQFGSMNDFFNGNVYKDLGDQLQQAFTGPSRVPLAIYSLGLYAQDTWKIKPNLTLTLALRADRNSDAVCQTGCFADPVAPFSSLNHDPTIPYNQAVTDGLSQAFPAIEKVALQPRFGFSWSPGFSHNTVLRGGIGLFSDLYPGLLLDSIAENAPNYNLFSTYGCSPAAGAGACGLVAPGTPGAAAPGVPASVQSYAVNSNSSFLTGYANGSTLAGIQAVNPFFTPPNLYSPNSTIQNPKYLEWNFMVEHQFGNNNVLSLNYVGNHGYDLLVQNQLANAAVGGSALPLPATPTDARFGTVITLQNDGISNYNGFVTNFTHRFSHGLQFLVNYTWSHSLDDAGSLLPFNFNQSIVGQIDPSCLRCLNYGSSDYDERHNFNATYVYNPTWKPGNMILNGVLGGWQFSQTFFLHSANPYSVTDYTALLLAQNDGVTTQPYILGTYLGGPTGSCSSPGTLANPNLCVSANQFAPALSETSFGNLARNSFRGPGYFNSDFNAMKNFNITERFKLRVGANFFNVFNHPNFQAPSSNLTSSNFGQLYATVSPATSPYGSFQGAGVSGRLIQLEAHIQF